MIATLLGTAVITAVLVLVMWPSDGLAYRVLVKWGVPAPAPEQYQAAQRYLRRRRVLYPVFVVMLPGVVTAATASWARGPLDGHRVWGLLSSVLAGLLLAELYATLRPPRGRTRSAALARRRWRDVLPWWGPASYLVILGFAVLQAVAALLAQSWAAAELRGRQPLADVAPSPDGVAAPGPTEDLSHLALDRAGDWLVLGGAAVGLCAVLTVVWLAVLRPAEADPEVDAALRTRTARVAVGVGIGLALGLLNQTNQQVSVLHSLSGTPSGPWLLAVAARMDGAGMLAAFAVGVLCWWTLASPPRRVVTAPA